MDLIVPSFVILGSAFMTRFLFMRNYTIGLFCGAAFVGLINIAVPSDSQSLITIQFGILISYLLFHGAFCRLRTIEIELGLGFVIGVTTGAVLVLAILSLIPKLADVWKYNTDLDGIWSFLPIHLVSFVLGAFAVDTIKPYIKKTSGSGNVLPVTVQDLPPATTSGREDQALPLHHRVNASSNAVQ
ncbi:hypothetical protein EJ02DRAFT_455368 [Clathrospora elynae]|uniref:Uncharacterized protein n=1 Tax=Clathrospora elynae TaxID=706981 RepID=A0A6A5SRE6_9PLEO|nr:hypothetical protein EJ02DRAFT_455368 [Clathrospora elynae]